MQKRVRRVWLEILNRVVTYLIKKVIWNMDLTEVRKLALRLSGGRVQRPKGRVVLEELQICLSG